MSIQGRWLSEAIGKILAKRRDQLGLTQLQVAESLRIQRTSLSHIESGKQVLHMDIFFDICKKLDISPTQVLHEAIMNLAEKTGPFEEIEKVIKETS